MNFVDSAKSCQVWTESKHPKELEINIVNFLNFGNPNSRCRPFCRSLRIAFGGAHHVDFATETSKNSFYSILQRNASTIEAARPYAKQKRENCGRTDENQN